MELLNAKANGAVLKECEELLFRLCRSENEPGAIFNGLVELIGKKYDVLAYLFFLRDWEKYLPIAASSFDDAFKRLGLELQTSGQRSWENYQEYLAALRLVQDRLSGRLDETARLVDAHSFCWMLVRLPAADEEKGAPARIITIVEPTGLVPGSHRELKEGTGSFESIDYVKRNERNRYLGNLAEEIALESEQQRLRDANAPNLAGAARLVSEDPRLGYDLHSFDADGQPRHIEVKSCSSGERAAGILPHGKRATGEVSGFPTTGFIS